MHQKRKGKEFVSLFGWIYFVSLYLSCLILFVRTCLRKVIVILNSFENLSCEATLIIFQTHFSSIAHFFHITVSKA